MWSSLTKRESPTAGGGGDVFGYRRVLDSVLGDVDDGPVQVEIRAWITKSMNRCCSAR